MDRKIPQNRFESASNMLCVHDFIKISLYISPYFPLNGKSSSVYAYAYAYAQKMRKNIKGNFHDD